MNTYEVTMQGGDILTIWADTKDEALEKAEAYGTPLFAVLG